MKEVRLEKLFLVGQADIYPDLFVDPKMLLKDVPLGAALSMACYILHLYSERRRDDPEFQSRHLMQWMMKLENQDKVIISNFIQKNSPLVFGPSFKLIDRRSFLNLIQHILVYSRPGSDQLSSRDHSAIFKCLLYFNSRENEAQQNLFQWDGSGYKEQFADLIMVAQVRNLEHERPKDHVVQFLKVYYFFRFIESHNKYAGLLKIFLSTLGITSYVDYLFKIMSPYLHLRISETVTPVMHIDGDGTSGDFYSRLTINENITGIDKDYRPLRQFPLFEIAPRTFVFLDHRFFVDKFFQGFLFDFATITKVSYSTLKSDMGNEFSEHVLFYTIMKKCFGNYGDVRLAGEEIKSKISEGEPDYYIRKGKEIFLFEFKDLLLSADIKYSGDAARIKEGIAEKLEKNSEGKRKGITQLLHTINEISKGIYIEKGVDAVDSSGLVIYPIIVHTDITLESCGVNYFLNKRMKELVDGAAITHIGVKDLVLINLDTLVKLQDHFANGKLDLNDSVKAYIKYISSDDPQTATYPFDEFVKYFFTEKNKENIGEPKDFDLIIKSFSS